MIRVLVMDDEHCIRVTIQLMLEDYGFSVDCASNGDEAIQLYSEAIDNSRPYDLVLLDLIIKGSYSGYEALSLLKELNPNVKAILISGSHYSEPMIDHKRFGFCSILRKPYMVAELIDTINKCISLPTT